MSIRRVEYMAVTATRDGLTYPQQQVWRYRVARGLPWLLHGDCLGGDAETHYIALRFRATQIWIFPPSDPKQRAYCRGYHRIEDPAPFLVRNHRMVDAAEALMAFPKGFAEEWRSGTWATIRYAKRRKRPLVIVYPDGTQEPIGSMPSGERGKVPPNGR